MIDQVDAHLRAWIQSVVQVSSITFAPPTEAPDDEGVSLYLLDLASAVPSNGAGRKTVQLSLRYLVTTWAKEMETAHRWLGTLVVAAMANSEFEVELERLPFEVWVALRTIPRPAFILKAPLYVDRPEPTTPLVRAPIQVQGSPLGRLDGRVLSPNGLPLSDIRLEIPSLGVVERTDRQGWFHFRTIPAAPPLQTIRLTAHGKQVDVEIDPSHSPDEPLLIHFDPTAREPIVTK